MGKRVAKPSQKKVDASASESEMQANGALSAKVKASKTAKIDWEASNQPRHVVGKSSGNRFTWELLDAIEQDHRVRKALADAPGQKTSSMRPAQAYVEIARAVFADKAGYSKDFEAAEALNQAPSKHPFGKLVKNRLQRCVWCLLFLLVLTLYLD